MKTRLSRAALGFLISVGISAAFGYYLYVNADKYVELLMISKLGVFGLFLISLGFPLLNGMQNTYLYRNLGLEEFSHRDGFLITAASTLANQLPIPGGVISKGYYLKQRYNLSYAKFTSSTVALYFCFLAVSGIIGVAVVLYWKLFKNTAVSPVLTLGFMMMSACLPLFWLPLDRINMPEKIHSRVFHAIDGWMVICRNPGLLLKLAVLQSVVMVLLSLRFWISFHMLSQNVSMGQTLLFAGASVLTQLVTIAPGGLGVREAIVAGIASLFGFDVTISVVAVGLDRLISTITIVVVGWVSSVILGKQLVQIQEAKES